jgi:hypothetical protein
MERSIKGYYNKVIQKTAGFEGFIFIKKPFPTVYAAFILEKDA